MIGSQESLHSQHWSSRFSLGHLLIYLVLFIIFVVMAYPFFYILFLAVMPYENYIKESVHALPSGFTLLQFQEILKEPGLARGFTISILRTMLGTALSVVLTSLAGFALSRRQLKHRRFLTFFFLIPMFFSGGIVPYFLTVRATGLINTFWALIIPGLVTPMLLFIARSFFLDYPDEIIQAATIDGAGPFRIFWSVIWPTSTPVISTLTMMYGIGYWNEYFWSRLLVGRDLWPATAHLYSLMNNKLILEGLGIGIRLTKQSYIAAVAAMLIIPMLIAYPFLQRYVLKGMLLGAIKS